ncbi:hypothetical protein [Sulfurimonas sp.]|uniref:hypothetical protein n=1 Tax=Sulfurimonas sp. TaxID=2022749 RepID=UPI0025CE5486|nr:hypothetical protein [Sulfurimonas sp.]MBW6488802.1 hypothetical protein [Sulfurimonas sp.]
MRKILSIVAISIAAFVLGSGCASSLEMAPEIEKSNGSIPETAIYVGHHKSEDVLKAVKAAAKKEGWRVTEFKSEAVLVEKSFNGETASSTIIYHNQHIYGDNKNAPMDELLKLRGAIVEELQKEEKH